MPAAAFSFASSETVRWNFGAEKLARPLARPPTDGREKEPEAGRDARGSTSPISVSGLPSVDGEGDFVGAEWKSDPDSRPLGPLTDPRGLGAVPGRATGIAPPLCDRLMRLMRSLRADDTLPFVWTGATDAASDSAFTSPDVASEPAAEAGNFAAAVSAVGEPLGVLPAGPLMLLRADPGVSSADALKLGDLECAWAPAVDKAYSAGLIVDSEFFLLEAAEPFPPVGPERLPSRDRRTTASSCSC